MHPRSAIEVAVLLVLLTPGTVWGGVSQSQPSTTGTGETKASPGIQLVLAAASRAGTEGSTPSGKESGRTKTAEQTLPDVLRLGLKEAVDLALRQNPRIQIANLRTLESHGAFITTRSGYLPQMNLLIADSYQTANLQALGITFPGAPTRVGPFQVFDARPVLRQTILDLSLLKRLDILREQIRQSQLDAMSVRESTLLSVIQLYLQVLAADSRFSATEARLHTAEALLARAKDFLEAGTGNLLDKTRAEVELQNESRVLVEVKRDRDTIQLLLMKTIGVDLDRKVELSDRLKLPASEEINVTNALTGALENRSEMKALQSKLKTTLLEKERAKAERYPTIEFSTDYGVVGSSIAQNLSTYSVKGSLNFPILQGGRIKGEIEAANARYKQVEEEMEELKLEIQLDVHTALVQMDASKQATEAAQKATSAARASLDLARQAFEGGVSDNLEVISAQEAVAIAEDNEIHSLFDFTLAHANLARAGGDVAGFLK